MKQDMILILDLGSEENPKIAREIRAMGVYTEIHAHDITAGELRGQDAVAQRRKCDAPPLHGAVRCGDAPKKHHGKTDGKGKFKSVFHKKHRPY